MKRDTNFFKVWGGISGVQHLLPLLIGSPEAIDHFGGNAGEAPALPAKALSLVSKLTSFNVAERFRLPKTRGRIEVGARTQTWRSGSFREKLSCAQELFIATNKAATWAAR